MTSLLSDSNAKLFDTYRRFDQKPKFNTWKKWHSNSEKRGKEWDARFEKEFDFLQQNSEINSQKKLSKIIVSIVDDVTTRVAISMED